MAFRILVAADMHAEEEAAERIVKKISSGKFGALIILGDITNLGPVSFAEDFFSNAKAAAPKTRIFAIPGNMDPYEVLEVMEKKGASIQGKKAALSGPWEIVGLGGSPRAGRGPTEYDEDEALGKMRKLGIGPRTILAAHSPAYELLGLDKIPSGLSVGSRALRSIVEEKKPGALLSGHIHETEGIGKSGETVVVKVAPAFNGRAAILELGKGIKAELINL